MEWEVVKLECIPRGYSGLQCWGYDEDDKKFPIGPWTRSKKFYSVNLDLENATRVTSYDDLRFVIDFADPRLCRFDLHDEKIVKGKLSCPDRPNASV